MILAALALAAGSVQPSRAPASREAGRKMPGRESLGVFAGWGAFRDASPARCYAIAVPARIVSRPGRRPFASIVRPPGRGRPGTFFVRLSTMRAEDEPVTLSVGERRFRLAGRGDAAWSPDEVTARALVPALRGERSMSIAAVSAGGRPFADTYPLAGAATAIDAAVLGCLR